MGYALLAFIGLELTLQPATPIETNTVPSLNTNSVVKEVQPAQIALSPALAEVVRLAQSGADESVIIAYVQKAPAYQVSADEIIYLQDLGISDAVLQAVAGNARSATAPPAVPSTNVVGVTNAAVPSAPEPQPVASTAAPPATVTEFYEPLTPYGTWVDIAPYGWCWQPSVVVINSSWRPYCDNGYWLWSDSGWYWHSYYSWGWAPFHYGRWYHHPHRRWVWVPDRVWGPSWVSWRYGGDYCGWAPLPPGAHFSVGVGWTFGGSRVGPDFGFGLSAGHFTFVAASHFADRRLAARTLPRQQANVIFNNTTIVNNYAVGGNKQIINRGVDRGRIEAATRRKIPEVTVRELPREAQRVTMPDRVTKVGRSDVVYRPGAKIEVPGKPFTPSPLQRPSPATVSGTERSPARPQPAIPPPQSRQPTVPVPDRRESERSIPQIQPTRPTPPASVQPKVSPAPSRPRVAPPNAPPQRDISPRNIPPRPLPQQRQGEWRDEPRPGRP